MSALLTGPQLAALFFLRDETAHGGAYVGHMRQKPATFSVLYRFGLIASDRLGISGGGYVLITDHGRRAIANLPRPVRSRS
jgi:hypothetical protein